MTPDTPAGDGLERVASIFEHAVELSGDEQAAYLDEMCGDDAPLRAEIESMLAAHRSQGAFLANPSHAATVTPGPGEPGASTIASASERIGQTISAT